MRKLLLLFVPLVAAVLVSAGCGTAKPFAAKVNDSEISQDDLDEELGAILANADYLAGIEQQGTQVRGAGKGTFDTQFVARVLTRQVLLQLVHDELANRKALPSAAELGEAAEEVTQSTGGPEIFGKFKKPYQDILVRRAAEVTKLQAALSPTPVDDAAVRGFYDTNPAQFAATCVSHILVAVAGPDGRLDQQATQAEAPQLKAQADQLAVEIAGGADFAAVAAASSKDASNKEKGGSLGCLSKSDVENFAPPFVVAMDALPVGQVSPPVQTDFGFHLIKVTERKVQSFEEAAPEIRQQLLAPTQQEFSTFIRTTLDKAKISVNPRYGKFDKKAQSPGVVPPEAPSPRGSPGTGAEPGDGTPLITTPPAPR